MARKTKPLTDTEVKAAKLKDANYQLYDGDGLTLLIKSSGSKLWQFHYYHQLLNQAPAGVTNSQNKGCTGSSYAYSSTE